MSRHLVLLEHLGAPGGADADARARASVLQQAGFDVECLAVDPAVTGPPGPPRPNGRVVRVGLDRDGAGALHEAVTRRAPEAVVVASPEPGAATVARLLPPGTPAAWWPTGVLPPARVLAGGLEPLGGAPAGGLEWGLADAPRGGRSRLPLWDGDYVLVPLPLAGDAGRAALAAFARVAAEEDGLDCVVLADPQPDFEAEARRLGVGLRVHFAGAAPREAELSWWASAQAALLAHPRDFAAGLVWRGLASACPLVVTGSEPAAETLRAWLDAEGALPGPREAHRAAPAEALGRALALDPATRLAVERGRVLAGQRPRVLAARLAVALGAGPARRAA